MNTPSELGLVLGLFLSLSSLACSSSAGDGADSEDTSDNGAELRIGGGGSGPRYQCTEWTCTCDATIKEDCIGISTYCKNNGGDGTVHCSKTGLCICSLISGTTRQ